jgi:hypothetical protein
LAIFFRRVRFKLKLFFSGSAVTKLSREERMVQCIGDIIVELIHAQKESKDVNLVKTVLGFLIELGPNAKLRAPTGLFV